MNIKIYDGLICSHIVIFDQDIVKDFKNQFLKISQE